MDKQTLSHEVVKQLHLCGHFLHFRMGCMSGKNRIMGMLHKHGPMLQKQLQEDLRIQSGSISEIIIKMEADGLIQKCRCEHDGRNFVLSLTEKGQHEAQQRRDQLDATAEQLMDGVSQEELAILHESLSKLLKNWHESGQFKEGEKA